MVPRFVKKLFLYSAAHTYSNLSRLFLRLFTGIMFMQFGIRQWIYFDEVSASMIGVLGMTPQVSAIVLIAIEIICSLMIILGLFSRLALLPPIVAMTVAEDFILNNIVDVPPAMLFSTQPGYVPILFIGIFVYMLLAGPGKVSLDYLISLHLLGGDDSDSGLAQEELDELEKA